MKSPLASLEHTILRPRAAKYTPEGLLMELFIVAHVKLDYAKRKFSSSLAAAELIVSGSHSQLIWLLKKHPDF